MTSDRVGNLGDLGSCLHKPSVEFAPFWRLFGNRGVEYLPAHLFSLTDQEIEDVTLHQAVPACVWAWTAHNSIYRIDRVEGFGVCTDDWNVFATEELAKNFLAALDDDT